MFKNSFYANFIIEFVFSLIIKKKNYLELGFEQRKATELNSKSAPSILGFLTNGDCRQYSIFSPFIF